MSDAENEVTLEAAVAYYGSRMKKRVWKDHHLALAGPAILHFRTPGKLKEVISLTNDMSVSVPPRGEEVWGRLFTLTLTDSHGREWVFSFGSAATASAWGDAVAAAIASSLCSGDGIDVDLDAHVWYHGSTLRKATWKYHTLSVRNTDLYHYRENGSLKATYVLSPGDDVRALREGEKGKPNELCLSVGKTKELVFAFTSWEEARLWEVSLRLAMGNELDPHDAAVLEEADVFTGARIHHSDGSDNDDDSAGGPKASTPAVLALPPAYQVSSALNIYDAAHPGSSLREDAYASTHAADSGYSYDDDDDGDLLIGAHDDQSL